MPNETELEFFGVEYITMDRRTGYWEGWAEDESAAHCKAIDDSFSLSQSFDNSLREVIEITNYGVPEDK